LQQSAVPRFDAIPAVTTHDLLLVQFVSDPLREQFIAAGDWQIAFAARLANAGATFQWGGRAALFVMDGRTGHRRATIINPVAVGSAGRTATAERTCLDTLAGVGAQAYAGDCLVLELGIRVVNSAAALAPQASLFAQGVSPITTDNAATTDAAAILEAPKPLLLSLPQAGENPLASVTREQAVAMVKEAWPPFTERVYDWDSPGAIAWAIFETIGDAMKVYGYDQVDRVFRELSPLTMVELIPAWESLLGITLSDAALRSRSVARRRQTILARLREMGPLTIHNLAAIFASLAGYVAPDRPEVITLLAADMEAPNTIIDPIPGAIPVGTGFDNTNLVRYSETPLDGGEVSGMGVVVTLNLSAATSEGLHVRLRGPTFADATWTGGPNLTTAVKLRSPAHVGLPVHGTWQLNVYRDAGSPAVTLNSWSLYVLGRRWGGRSEAKHIWSVYLDPAHQNVDRRDIDTTLDRITQSHCEGFVIFDRTSIPGTNTHRAGRFIPGAP
jgi:subtilisin-like proprotein convertase family protein